MIAQDAGADFLASVPETGVSITIGALVVVLLGYLFRSYWKQGGYWEQLTTSARSAETLARADASAARAEAAAAYAEAKAARIAADLAHVATEHCEAEHAETRHRLQALESRLKELGFDV